MCPIYPEEAAPTPNPPLEYCTFEDDLCGWKNVESDFVFNRTTGQGLIDADVEGPMTDHTRAKNSKLKISLSLRIGLFLFDIFYSEVNYRYNIP